MSYRYVGHMRSGTGVVGNTPTLGDFVERCHRNRWIDLTVQDESGNEVGSIVEDEDTGRRIWWSE